MRAAGPARLRSASEGNMRSKVSRGGRTVVAVAQRGGPEGENDGHELVLVVVVGKVALEHADRVLVPLSVPRELVQHAVGEHEHCVEAADRQPRPLFEAAPPTLLVRVDVEARGRQRVING